MVGLVVVSHSRALAEAVCRLAAGVSRGKLSIAFAGGAGDKHADLGTDATDIMDAIRRVDGGVGVLVLMDLGSAVLSARLAREMLADEIPDIRLCPAPLVEGAVAAAVQIGAGADIETVCRDAGDALVAKLGDMEADGAAPSPSGPPAASAPSAPSESAAPPESIPADARTIRFTLDDPNGLHTRPAALLVKALADFPGQARIRNYFAGAPAVNARSINQVALANVRRGDVAEVILWGDGAERARAAVSRLIAGELGGAEMDELPAPVVVSAALPEREEEPEPVALSPGVALGRLFLVDSRPPAADPVPVDDAEAEVRRFNVAIEKVGLELSRRRSRLGQEDPGVDAVLEAQSLILDDAEVLERVRAAIRRESLDAAGVYRREMTALADRYLALPDDYMRERAADVNGVAAQVIQVLSGHRSPDAVLAGDIIVCADEVTPTALGRWSRDQLKGVVTRCGGPTSHVAILARSLGIPAVVGFSPPATARTGDWAALDAGKPEVIFQPDPGVRADFTGRLAAWKRAVEQDQADSRGLALTGDGVRVRVEANIGDLATAETAVQNGAEGVGLLRTEFLYLDRRAPPGEEEQVRAMTAVFARFAGLPVTVRTLDAGGDKTMPWLHMQPGGNPFLGVRGIRLVMKKPELFDVQIRALLRAGAGGDVRIMVPMIALREEIDFVQDRLVVCHRRLEEEGVRHLWPVRTGIMVETPAAVLQAENLAAAVDFFSVGTNDLVQYVMCAERGSRELSRLSDPMHPAVLRAVSLIVKGAAGRGVEVAVCGEMAGDPVAARALVGLGVRILSMTPGSIGPIKRTIRRMTVADDAGRALRAMASSSAAEARRLFGE